MIDLKDALGVYLVVGPENVAGDMYAITESALRGGVSAVQLRAKHLSDRELYSAATQVKELCERHSALFLVNDRIDIAMASGADGVHLGVDDLPLEVARSLAGPDFIIGFSPETDEQIRSARDRGASYLGIGPIFGTSTKADAGDALGLSEFSRRLQLGNLLTVGIGGITAGNAAEVLNAGADGIAVVSAILSANDPEKAANQLSRNSKRSSTRGSSAGSQ